MATDITIKPLSLEELVSSLHNNKPFTITRWGDGEWNCILGAHGANCDGHIYFPDLSRDLRKVLLNNYPYYHGLLDIALHDGRDVRVSAFLYNYRIRVNWYDGDTLLRASMRGELFPFIHELRQRRILYVGPARLKVLDRKAFHIEEFVTVPLLNCYDVYDRVLGDTYEAVESCRCNTILFSAGMMTKVLADQLYGVFGRKVTMIDCGSMFDIYAGFVTRSYAKYPEWRRLIKINLGGSFE